MIPFMQQTHSAQGSRPGIAAKIGPRKEVGARQPRFYLVPLGNRVILISLGPQSALNGNRRVRLFCIRWAVLDWNGNQFSALNCAIYQPRRGNHLVKSHLCNCNLLILKA